MHPSANALSAAPVYFYELDRDDRIVECSDTWDSFALENDGEHLVFEKIRSTSIWDHITDAETQDIYRSIFSAARKGKVIQFFLRCDSPTIRRMLSAIVEKAEGDRIRISNLLFREDKRAPLTLRADEQDSPRLKIPACSWCEKVRLPEIEWQEVEAAAAWLNKHDLPPRCRMTYTICPNCKRQIQRQLDIAQ